MKTKQKSLAEPKVSVKGHILQQFGTVVKMPISLKEQICKESVLMLNSVLADTMMLRDLYKKHHWQVVGPNFYSLHLLFDKHYSEQVELVDAIAERIQMLGGVSIAMGKDADKLTAIPSPPMDREEPSVQLSRLAEAHEIILKKVRSFACKCQELGDDGTNDLLVSNVMRTNEMQAWFISEHLV